MSSFTFPAAALLAGLALVPAAPAAAALGPGTYAIAVRHDADKNGKSGWNDGGGFSNNPRLSLLKLRPSHRSTAVTVGHGVTTVSVVLNYRRGLAVGPIGAN